MDSVRGLLIKWFSMVLAISLQLFKLKEARLIMYLRTCLVGYLSVYVEGCFLVDYYFFVGFIPAPYPT